LANSNSKNYRLLVDPTDEIIPITRQCSLLGLSKSTYYYTPVGESEQNLTYMRLMDEQYHETPFYGIRSANYILPIY